MCIRDRRSPDFTVVIGGDGTLYYYLDELEGSVLLIGSERSYRAQLSRGNWRKGILKAMKGRPVPLPILDVHKGRTHIGKALNDVVFHSNDHRVVSVDVSMNGKRLKFRGDGLIIATPFGSTAYSYSAGGKKLRLGSRSIAITPICPCFRGARPFTGKFSEVKVSVSRNASLLLDGVRVKGATRGTYVVRRGRGHIDYLQ